MGVALVAPCAIMQPNPSSIASTTRTPCNRPPPPVTKDAKVAVRRTVHRVEWTERPQKFLTNHSAGKETEAFKHASQTGSLLCPV